MRRNNLLGVIAVSGWSAAGAMSGLWLVEHNENQNRSEDLLHLVAHRDLLHDIAREGAARAVVDAVLERERRAVDVEQARLDEPTYAYCEVQFTEESGYARSSCGTSTTLD